MLLLATTLAPTDDASAVDVVDAVEAVVAVAVDIDVKSLLFDKL